MDQLTLIFDVVGSPQPHEVAHIRNSQAKKFLESMQDRVKVRLTQFKLRLFLSAGGLKTQKKLQCAKFFRWVGLAWVRLG